jgi:hypothetical protein
MFFACAFVLHISRLRARCQRNTADGSGVREKLIVIGAVN